MHCDTPASQRLHPGRRWLWRELRQRGHALQLVNPRRPTPLPAPAPSPTSPTPLTSRVGTSRRGRTKTQPRRRRGKGPRPADQLVGQVVCSGERPCVVERVDGRVDVPCGDFGVERLRDEGEASALASRRGGRDTRAGVEGGVPEGGRVEEGRPLPASSSRTSDGGARRRSSSSGSSEVATSGAGSGLADEVGTAGAEPPPSPFPSCLPAAAAKAAAALAAATPRLRSLSMM